MDREKDTREYTPYRAEAPRSRAVSAVSPIDPDPAYDPHPPAAGAAAEASRDSMDVQFHRHEHLSPISPASRSSTWTSALGKRQYTPYSPLASPSSATNNSRLSGYSYASALSPKDEANIDADSESYDLALLSAAAPVAGYDAQETAAADSPVDVSAMLGPTTPHDAAFLKKLQQEEASGKLTGGLGQGFRPDARMRDADLLASAASSPVQRHMSRSFSRLGSSKMSRNQTLRYYGQDEANRQGKVIEVVVEEEPVAAPGADLSSMEGTAFVGRAKDEVTHVFYPQPNWRPWPLQWPYLTMLVILSIALAVLQEVLLRHYSGEPIVVFRKPIDFTPGMHFVIKFMPTLTAVVFGVLWQFADFEVRRLEPFYQLSKEGGALAAESINVDYVTMFRFLRPFYALQKGHYVVAIMSAGATLAAALVPTFAAATIALSPSREERIKHPTDPKELRFDPVWCRLLTSTLAVVAACGVGVLFLNRNRRTGLLADVRGIAGLASMAVVSHILMDFKDMDTAKPSDIHNKLKRHRYMLKNSSLAPDDENLVTSEDREMDTGSNLPEHPHPLMLRARGCIVFVVYTLAFTGFIPAFLFSRMGWIPDHAPWLVTLLAVVVKLAWGSLEEAVRVMEPYYILSKRHAPSKTLTLDYTAMPWGYLPARALANGHTLVFLMGFGSVMAEFMTIMVSSLATVDGQDFLVTYDDDGTNDGGINAGQETIGSFYVSVAVSLFCLVYMATVALLVFFRRRHPFLPRQPTTIASVLAFLHQSKMLYTFVGTSKLTPAQMVQHLDDGSTYGLGWFEGRDGQTHCGIDQEELISGYKHGIDFAQGIQPWNTRWDVL